MNFLIELKVLESESAKNDNSALVFDYEKAYSDLLIIPGSSRIEYRVRYQNNATIDPKFLNSVEYKVVYKNSVATDTEFLSSEGYIIPSGSTFSLEIRYNDTDIRPTLDDVLELGFTIESYDARQNVDVWDAPIGSFSLTPYFCGLKIAKSINENMRAISPFGEYGHQSMTVIKEGRGYTAFTANNVTMKEYDDNTFSRLAVYDLADPENARFYTVAGKGDNGNIKIDGVSSLVSIVDNGENLVCNCYGFVDGTITEFRRVFDINTESLSELEVCKIVKDGVKYDFTNENVAALFGAEYGLTKIEIEMGVGPYVKYNEEWYTWLYTGSKRFSGILFKTRDFLNFEFVMIPKECRGTKCEIIPYLFKDHLYVAFRRDYAMQRLEVVKYDMKTLTPLESIVLKDTAMRPYFYEYNDELYLMHSPHTRHYTSIVKLSTERRFKMSRCVACIENLHMCTPCPVMYDGELYVTFSARHGSYSQIFISHFSPEMPYSEDEINDNLLKFIEDSTK